MAGASIDDGAIGVAEDGAIAGASIEEADGAIGVADDGAMAGASIDEAGAIADETIEVTVEAADDITDMADEAIASEDDGAMAADDETTAAELDGAVLTTVVVLPRLKIQMRPMITITATMMIIQVLRFMGLTLGSRKKVDREE